MKLIFTLFILSSSLLASCPDSYLPSKFAPKKLLSFSKIQKKMKWDILTHSPSRESLIKHGEKVFNNSPSLQATYTTSEQGALSSYTELPNEEVLLKIGENHFLKILEKKVRQRSRFFQMASSEIKTYGEKIKANLHYEATDAWKKLIFDHPINEVINYAPENIKNQYQGIKLAMEELRQSLNEVRPVSLPQQLNINSLLDDFITSNEIPAEPEISFLKNLRKKARELFKKKPQNSPPEIQKPTEEFIALTKQWKQLQEEVIASQPKELKAIFKFLDILDLHLSSTNIQGDLAAHLQKDILTSLDKHFDIKVMELNPSIKANPDFHNVIAIMPESQIQMKFPGQKIPSHHIVANIKLGFIRKGKVIRYADVMVAQ